MSVFKEGDLVKPVTVGLLPDIFASPNMWPARVHAWPNYEVKSEVAGRKVSFFTVEHPGGQLTSWVQGLDTLELAEAAQ